MKHSEFRALEGTCRAAPCGARRRRLVAARLPVVLLLASVCCNPLWAQQSAPADDTLGLTTVAKDALSESVTPGADAGPVQLTILDVLTRLALLVLAAYGVAWGISVARKSGLRIGRVGLTSQNVRLRECERLSLGPGTFLHVIEVDRRPVLLASSGNGEVKLVLDLAEAEQSAETPADPPRRMPSSPTATASTERLGFSLRDDAEWQERRDALIRSLGRSG